MACMALMATAGNIKDMNLGGRAASLAQSIPIQVATSLQPLHPQD